MVIERIPSGIPKLDELIEGGFVKGSCILISGYPGAGKTIFGFQFLLEGLKRGEKGIYFSLEETREDLLDDIERFGWKEIILEKEKEGKFLIHNILPSSIDKISSEIIRYTNLLQPQRIVIDSITLMENAWETYQDIGKLRRSIFSLIKELKSKKITILLLSEAKKDEIGFEEFLVDGVIKLYYLAKSLPRALQITKMRKTKHSLELIPFEITDNGIILKKII
ncbi:MAG: ATPase domain-containing protein [Nanopusillaceae archaeon]